MALGNPRSVNLADYAVPGSGRITATLLYNDPLNAVPDIKVRLKLIIQSTSLKIQTIESFRTQPIFLANGAPEILTDDDFAAYFNLNNLDFIGGKGKIPTLPDDFYSFSLVVYDYEKLQIRFMMIVFHEKRDRDERGVQKNRKLLY